MAQHLGFDPGLQEGLGTLNEENIQLVASLLERLLSRPYQLRFRDTASGQHRVRILAPRQRMVPPNLPLVRIMLSKQRTALLVISDPRYEEWEVAVGSSFYLRAGQDAYFSTPEGKEYLVHIVGSKRDSPTIRVRWSGDRGEVYLAPPEGARPTL